MFQKVISKNEKPTCVGVQFEMLESASIHNAAIRGDDENDELYAVQGKKKEEELNALLNFFKCTVFNSKQ